MKNIKDELILRLKKKGLTDEDANLVLDMSVNSLDSLSSVLSHELDSYPNVMMSICWKHVLNTAHSNFDIA